MDDFISVSNMNSFEDIKNIMYINLEHRTDRKEHVEYQLRNVVGFSDRFVNIERVNAVKLANGALGCSLSHLKCLQQAKERNLDHVLICEDDITFFNPIIFREQMTKFLETNKEWDVLLIAGNNFPPYKKIDSTCIQVSYCQTTTGYLIRNHYYDTLIENIKTGISFLLRSPEEHTKYAIDKYWINLQKTDTWYLLIPLTIAQLHGYSDIQQETTNYMNAMLSIK